MSDRLERFVSTHTTPVDRRLSPDEGWIGMEVQWLVSRQTGSRHSVVGRTIYHPSRPGTVARHALHFHPHAEETIVVLRGKARIFSGDTWFDAGPGEMVFVPAGDAHEVQNADTAAELEVYFVYAGASSLEEAGYVELPR